MTTEISKTWKTPTGKTATVTGKLITEKNVYADGYNLTVPTCEIYVNVTVEGHGDQGGNVREMTAAEKSKAPAIYTHVVGKMALTTEAAQLINSVRDELEALPEWQELQARIAKNRIAVAEYEAHVREIDRMMNM